MKIHCIALITVTGLSLAAAAYAATPLATDDTSTQGMMKFQVEIGGEFGWDRHNSNGTTVTTDSQSLSAFVTAGVIDPLDLILTVPFSRQQVTENGMRTYDDGGLNDISLALKWRFLEYGPASLAVKSTITFPSGNYNRGLGNARPAYGATLISTVELKAASISANVGYTNQKYTDAARVTSRADLWNLSLSGTVDVMKELQLVAEIGTASNVNRASTDWPTFITGGVIYSVTENLQLCMGVKIGLTTPETDLSLLPGISYNFP